MNPRRWLLTTLSFTLAAAGVIVGVNVVFDIYGQLRPVLGRQLPVYGDERVAKYLLSWRYVPENFNALLVGASITANWNVHAIDRLRVYNASINGGNIIEERALVDAALNRPGINVALLLVHPALTYDREFRTVAMTPDLRRSALGSLALWEAYKQMLNERLGRLSQGIDNAGVADFGSARIEMNTAMKAMWNAPSFPIDSVAFQAYLAVVANLRTRGVSIVFIVPPTSDSLVRAKGVMLDAYYQHIRASLGSGDLWIDFHASDYDAFAKNPANFTDGVHLSPSGAALLVRDVNQRIGTWMDDRRLVVSAHSR